MKEEENIPKNWKDNAENKLFSDFGKRKREDKDF